MKTEDVARRMDLSGTTVSELVRETTILELDLPSPVIPGLEPKEPGRKQTIRQFPPLALPFVVGWRVVVFLGPPSEGAFDLMLGEGAGIFRVVVDKDHPDLVMVENLLGNGGLWGTREGDDLWSAAITEDAIRLTLSSLALDEQSVDTIVKEYGSQPCQRRPIPLDLVRAAILAYDERAGSRHVLPFSDMLSLPSLQ